MTVHHVHVQPVGLGVYLVDRARQRAKISRKNRRGQSQGTRRSSVDQRHDFSLEARVDHHVQRTEDASRRAPVHHAQPVMARAPSGWTSSSVTPPPSPASVTTPPSARIEPGASSPETTCALITLRRRSFTKVYARSRRTVRVNNSGVIDGTRWNVSAVSFAA